MSPKIIAVNGDVFTFRAVEHSSQLTHLIALFLQAALVVNQFHLSVESKAARRSLSSHSTFRTALRKLFTFRTHTSRRWGDQAGVDSTPTPIPFLKLHIHSVVISRCLQNSRTHCRFFGPVLITVRENSLKFAKFGLIFELKLLLLW